MQASAWWPALVTVVDHALARGESLDALLSMASTHDPDGRRRRLPGPGLAGQPPDRPHTHDDDTPLPHRRSATTTSSGSPRPHPGLEPATATQVEARPLRRVATIARRRLRRPERRRRGPHRHGRPGTNPGRRSRRWSPTPPLWDDAPFTPSVPRTSTTWRGTTTPSCSTPGGPGPTCATGSAPTRHPPAPGTPHPGGPT